MATEISSIDDVLAAHVAGDEPELDNYNKAPESIPEPIEQEQPEKSFEDEKREYQEKLAEPEEAQQEAPQETSRDTDEYGNEKPPPRTYTQQEVDEYANKLVRERLARLERNIPQQPPQQQYQPTPQQQQQAQQAGFQYNENSGETWDQQLRHFIRNEHYQIEQERAIQAREYQRQQAEQDLHYKFQVGAARFPDFNEVVGQNRYVTDDMAKALQGIDDPSAFIYAASKRAPEELRKIAENPNPIAQMVAIGRLSERMKTQKPNSKTPKPVTKTREDLSVKHGTDKEPSIEELIAQDAKRRLDKQRKR